MPLSITRRAEQILTELEKGSQKGEMNKPIGQIADQREGMQLSFFQLDDPVLEQIRDEITHLDINNLTPIEALNKLNDIKRIVRGK
jgi:DNA mismatch repair protein MutS